MGRVRRLEVGAMVYHALNRANFRSALFKKGAHYQAGWRRHGFQAFGGMPLASLGNADTPGVSAPAGAGSI